MSVYLGSMTAHDLRLRLEENQKYTQREMKKVVDESTKEVKLATWVQTALVGFGLWSGAAFTGWLNARQQTAATAETKATVKEVVAPVRAQLEQVLDGGLPDPARQWR